ncbi:LTA synthase family protein [Paenibacillus arenilitoris]|uniref:LTA synthase family protein n=1 Tax=Paenibacillus arenilitoris TaxID=2772299 RepID=A0A927CNG2_9BACL|nr:LTA synthase family protein [Paenibacillus arenilitoris]MBD2870630.1 LTA synthase family protein [Paenibacillus arenilitoris]
MLRFTDNGGGRSPVLLVFVLIMLKMILFRHFVFQGIQADKLLPDAAAVLVPLALVELFIPARWRAAAHGALNALLSLLLFASTLYFSYYGTVPTYTALHGLDQVLQIKDSVGSTIQAANYLFFLDLVIGLIFYAVNRIRGVRKEGRKRIARPAILAGIAVLCAAVSFFYIRSGSGIPNELVQAESLGFINYEIAAGLQAGKEKKALEDGSAEETAAAAASLQASYPYAGEGGAPAGKPDLFGAAKGMNVIVVQLEAFQNFPIRLKLDGTEVTPVLNKLADESFYFPHFFQQIGQGNTSDAEFMSNTSIYPTGEIAMSTGYGNREIPSLPRLLRQERYETSTFHINEVTFWDRNRMYPALGFDRYYDKPSFNNDHFNAFGASDEELYRVALEELKALQAQGKPFYTQIVTTSGHHPFKVPHDRRKIAVPERLAGTQLGDYLTAVNYTDYALGQFIDGLKASGLWEDTLLVVYGDHFGLQSQDTDAAWASAQLGIAYNELVSRFNIPLLIHVPGTAGKVVEQVGGQVDIMPTVAGLLGLSLKDAGYAAFGQDLLHIERNVIGMRYYLPTGSFFNNEILFVPGKGFEDGTAIDIRSMKPVIDFSAYRGDYDYILELMRLSDDYVRLLPKREP